MALPKLDVPIYELKLPSNNKKISYRPFLVKEEKILLMAMEGEDNKEITTSIKQIVNNCILTKNIDVDKLPLFDIEYILLNLRGKSMGDTIKTNYIHKNDDEKKCKPTEIEIDVNTIKIKKDPTHDPKIQLTNSVGIVMSYPDIDMMTKISDLSGGTHSVVAFDLIAKCIDQIYDEENVYNNTDHTPDELQEFLERLTPDQFKKIEHFFITIPKMYKDIEFKCGSCGHIEEIKLEGLASFFG